MQKKEHSLSLKAHNTAGKLTGSPKCDQWCDAIRKTWESQTCGGRENMGEEKKKECGEVTQYIQQHLHAKIKDQILVVLLGLCSIVLIPHQRVAKKAS